jgi:2-(1,2-epoxy-1,2-dihydrophenyl)acetyl-CoA isomerase
MSVDQARDGGVLTITFNRPDKLNALDAAMHEGLRAALEQAARPEIRAVVLTGAGRGFCVGQDLVELHGSTQDVATRLREGFNKHALAIRALEKPVLAAVNGPAAGAGLSLALACDVRIASDAASFVPAFIGIGLVPDTGGTWFARRLLGASRAFEWLTTNRRLTAAEALEWGLVSEVVPAEEFAVRVAEVAQLFASMPTRAVWETKQLLEHAEIAPLAQQLELEAVTQDGLEKTPDFTEGVAAFLEKRDAAFTGAPAERVHPVQLVVRDDLRRWRLTAVLRYGLAYPHYYVVAAWATLAIPVVIANWFATLVRERSPRGIHEWLTRMLRYATHLSAYLSLIADPYPPFRGWAGTYPVDLDVEPPAPQERWKTLLRIPLALPAWVLAYVLSVVMLTTALIGLAVSLVVGRMPRGMRDLMAYCLRYQVQTYAYLLLLTSRYPTLASGSGFQFEEA